MKIIGYIAAAILIFFGVLFIWSAFSPNAPGDSGGLILTGLVSTGIGFVIIWFASRKPAVHTTNVTLNIDMPGEMKMDSLKCKSCGGVITEADVKVVAGAPMVSCPYCKTTYQLSEEPKW